MILGESSASFISYFNFIILPQNFALSSNWQLAIADQPKSFHALLIPKQWDRPEFQFQPCWINDKGRHFNNNGNLFKKKRIKIRLDERTFDYMLWRNISPKKIRIMFKYAGIVWKKRKRGNIRKMTHSHGKSTVRKNSKSRIISYHWGTDKWCSE